MTAPAMKVAAAKGVRWNGLASALRAAFLLIRMAVLARLLDQRDFGLVSMVTVVLGYAQAYVDLGLSSALIQKQEQDPNRLSTIFWMNMIAGVLSGALLAALQHPIALLFKEPAIAELIPIAALQLPLVALGQQFEALFQRDLRFKLVAVVQIVADAVSTVVAFVLALGGYGAWSLVIATLVGASLNGVALFFLGIRHWPLRFTFQPSQIKSHLRFGAYQLANINIGYLTGNIDTVLIGRLLGSEALGIYTMAQRLTQMARRYINPVIAKVAFPVFAKQKDQKARMADSLLQLQRSLSHLNVPLIVGLGLVSPLLIPLMYGQKWAPAVPIVQWLSALALITGVAGPTQIVRTALGHVRFNFHWTWTTGILYALGMWAVAGQGLMAIVIVRTVLGAVLSTAMIGVTLRFLDASPRGFLLAQRVPALGAVLMSGAVLGVMALTRTLPPVVQLGLTVSVGAAVYLGIAAKLDSEFIGRSFRLLLGLKSAAERQKPRATDSASP